nr:MAG TPA: hypothetical protein [Caudoviricetes sp.]
MLIVHLADHLCYFFTLVQLIASYRRFLPKCYL